MKFPSYFFGIAFIFVLVAKAEAKEEICYYTLNADHELHLQINNGALISASFANSDWSQFGPEMAVTMMSRNDKSIIYQMANETEELILDNQVLSLKSGMAKVGNDQYDCGF